MKTALELQFRYEVLETDPATIGEIVRSTGFFHEHEIPVARELAEDRLLNGIQSGYSFVFGQVEGKVISYSCYGQIACTLGAYDLYWIVTHHDFRGYGAGFKILKETLRLIRQNQGRMLIAETSTTAQYAATRAFYEKNGFICEAKIADFYAPGDGKAIYVYRL
jgi:ribosomal protein S18 acetylase RimI-like enzyme